MFCSQVQTLMDCTELVETLLSFKNFALRQIMVMFFTFFSVKLVLQLWLCSSAPCCFFIFIFFAETEELNLEDGQWEDVHVITGALKLFFRELPEPLFPYSHFEAFISAISENFFIYNQLVMHFFLLKNICHKPKFSICFSRNS